MTQEELINKFFSTQITEENLQKILLILSSFGIYCPKYPNYIYQYKYNIIRRNAHGKLVLSGTNYNPFRSYTRLYLKDIIKL